MRPASSTHRFKCASAYTFLLCKRFQCERTPLGLGFVFRRETEANVVYLSVGLPIESSLDVRHRPGPSTEAFLTCVWWLLPKEVPDLQTSANAGRAQPSSRCHPWRL